MDSKIEITKKEFEELYQITDEVKDEVKKPETPEEETPEFLTEEEQSFDDKLQEEMGVEN